MEKHISLDLFNYGRKKLCNLYDSQLNAKGQAYNIIYTDSIQGDKTQTFTLPFTIESDDNFRWGFIKNEHLVRLTIDGRYDWFIVRAPKKTKNNKSTTNVVTCSHLSDILKTKSLWLLIDDTNGIGTLQYLVELVLNKSGWTLGYYDTMYETDGVTEKIRSISSNGKDGAKKLITDICTLFDAYPVYDGDNKRVEIYSLNNKQPLREMHIGKDVNSLTVEQNSDSLITRMYVEGRYDDELGYVNIEQVNPTGLTYLLNFDYYKEIGMFTDEHQAALDTYLETVKASAAELTTLLSTLSSKQNELNTLWGQLKCVIFNVKTNADGSQSLEQAAVQGEVDDDKKSIVQEDSVTILNGSEYREITAGENGSLVLQPDDVYAVKFITLPSGTIGAKQVTVEAKEKLIENLMGQIVDTMTDDEKNNVWDQVNKLQADIDSLYAGTEDSPGLHSLMHNAVALALEIQTLTDKRTDISDSNTLAEAAFYDAMGDMLKDGYWSTTSYTIGQEQFLYNDAVKVQEEMSRPVTKYTLQRKAVATALGYEHDDFRVNMSVRIYDPELAVNDLMYITKITMNLDKPQADTVEVSNSDISLTAVTLQSILSRMAEVSDSYARYKSVYDRAKALTANGSLYVDRLEGQIDILKNRLLSSVSSWYTDENGNIMFESTNGQSAMMLCGDGFMIANGKLEDGSWNWRSFGSGEGFTADVIVAGYLSADRIEAGAITASKLSSDVGQSLDLSSNSSINMTVQNQIRNYDYASETPPENPEEGYIWIDLSASPPAFRRWNGVEWIYLGAELSDENSLIIEDMRSSIDMNEERIAATVTKEVFEKEIGDKVSGSQVETIVSEALETSITSGAIQNLFTTQKERIDGLEHFKEEVTSYQRFTAEGLELGRSDSQIIAKLENDRLAFIENGNEVAYISDDKMYITEANVLNRVSYGNTNYGYFDFVVTSTGLAIKWRG